MDEFTLTIILCCTWKRNCLNVSPVSLSKPNARYLEKQNTYMRRIFSFYARDVYGNNEGGIEFFSKRIGNMYKKMYLDNAK